MRTDGYAAIEDYAIIGDGRTAALVASDGAIDWLCLPNFDSPSVFAAVLDVDRGGRFELRPAIPFSSTRRYLPSTNVLETTFVTDRGALRVVDAMTLPDGHLAPMRELVRSVEGLSGSVPMSWRFSPRFEYGAGEPRREWRGSVPVATFHADALAVVSWDAGTPAWGQEGAGATFDVRAGSRAELVLTSATAEPLVFPSRGAVERRLADTVSFWRRWTADRQYSGPWADSVLRSALTLKLLIFAPSGASVAAPTTSLPEEIGGERNWDYRFCWIRDSNFAIDALLTLGCRQEARSLFWWFMQATALTEPELHVLYRLDGGVGVAERDLALAGYGHSRPVRVGNSAVEQTQIDIYGALLHAAWLYSEGHDRLDADMGAVLERIADRVCSIWPQADAGIWEVRNGPFQFTHSKVMCWAALDRAIHLSERGELPSGHLARWRRESDAIRAFVETRCWSERLRSYRRIADEDDLDASLLMLPIVGYGGDGGDGGDPGSRDGTGTRINDTIDAIMRELRQGDFVYRYRAADGVRGGEGAFLNCSFWLVSALARVGRLDEAGELMDRLVARANDVGLYSEEIDLKSGTFLGNFPQALVHFALIDAAVAVRDGGRASGTRARQPRQS
jgi:GH15 family glucan-1,4-alpha-glucosidase